MTHIEKFTQFAFNYNHDFIQKAFGDTHIAKHLQAKFDSIYKEHGPKAVMTIFYQYLDSGNRTVLENYILSKLSFPFGFGDNERKICESIKDFSNRTLLKEYRFLLDRLKDIEQMESEGSQYFLGNRITLEKSKTKTEIKAYKFILVNRYGSELKVNKRINP